MAHLNFMAAALVLFSITPSFAQECDLGRVDVTTSTGETQFTIELADDAQERARGLMFREHLDPDAGMLFIYEEPVQAVFWMRNTLIGLDLIFADSQGVVQYVHPKAIPLDETPILGGDRIKYVLEINAGRAAELGISAGSKMRHPGFDADAVWPCS